MGSNKTKAKAKSTSGGTANDLRSAEEAFARGDHVAALTAALSAWTQTRDATIADAIDALSAVASRSFTPPDVRTNAELQKQWLALLKAKDPVAVQWLAESLFLKLPGSDVDAKQDAFLARLRAAKTSPDPRMAKALMTLVEQGAPIVNWSEDHCRKTLVVIGDERTRSAIDALIAKVDKDEARRWRATREKVPAASPALSDDERKAWSVLGPPRPTKKATGDRTALFDAVLAAPDDEQAREVLADCLQEQGDPRGEFISIQLAEEHGRATPEASKRAEQLLKEHKKAWLGPLARVTYRARFRRGFLDELELDGSWKVAAKAWPEMAKERLLATVGYVHGKPRPDIMAHFASSPAMRSLRSVNIDADVLADAVEKSAPRPTLREIRSLDWKRHDHLKRFRERIVPLIDAFPSVDSVVTTDDALEPLMQAASFERLKTLEIGIPDGNIVAVWSRLPKHITSLKFGWSFTAELRRASKKDDDAAVSLHVQLEDQWGQEWLEEELVPHLKKLDTLARIEIEVPKKKISPSFLNAIEKLRGKDLAIDVREPVFRSGLAAGMSG